MTKYKLLREETQCSGTQLTMLRQEDQEFKVNIGYLAESCFEKGLRLQVKGRAFAYLGAGMKDLNQVSKFAHNTASTVFNLYQKQHNMTDR